MVKIYTPPTPFISEFKLFFSNQSKSSFYKVLLTITLLLIAFYYLNNRFFNIILLDINLQMIRLAQQVLVLQVNLLLPVRKSKFNITEMYLLSSHGNVKKKFYRCFFLYLIIFSLFLYNICIFTKRISISFQKLIYYFGNTNFSVKWGKVDRSLPHWKISDCLSKENHNIVKDWNIFFFFLWKNIYLNMYGKFEMTAWWTTN